jgi:excisionase family DNA binding protein
METATRTKASRNRGQYGLLNRQEAAAELGISVKTLDALTQSGRLRAIQMTDRLVRYWPKDLEAFVTGRSEKED